MSFLTNMSFQKIVLMIASVLLVIVLITFGIAFHDNKDNKKFPPVQSQCPDFWEVKQGKDGITLCENVKELGKSNCQREMNFNVMPFIGQSGPCNKRKWANSCEITWDGITNAYGNC